MNSYTSYFKVQYQLVRESRQVLFDYCESISGADLVNENSSFGRGGSIRNLLVHVANTYQFWLVKHALQKHIDFTPFESIHSITGIRTLFEDIDKAVEEFIKRYPSTENTVIQVIINGNPKNLSPLELFTHVITHEFHHKGQILSLSRHLGYIPIDTDIIR